MEQCQLTIPGSGSIVLFPWKMLFNPANSEPDKRLSRLFRYVCGWYGHNANSLLVRKVLSRYFVYAQGTHVLVWNWTDTWQILVGRLSDWSIRGRMMSGWTGSDCYFNNGSQPFYVSTTFPLASEYSRLRPRIFSALLDLFTEDLQIVLAYKYQLSS